MGIKTIATNRKARFEYEILQTYETGIVLKGTEVKSLRAGRVSMGESHCRIDPSLEVSLLNLHINHYEFGNQMNHEPLRNRRLLMHKHEIRRLYGQTREKGLTLIPLKLYFKDGNVKVELGLAKGKKVHDKRESLKRKDNDRDLARSLKSY